MAELKAVAELQELREVSRPRDEAQAQPSARAGAAVPAAGADAAHVEDPPEQRPEGMRFDGKVALVTGAGSGLGRQFAKLLAARGARVVVNDLGTSVTGKGSAPSAADTTVEEIRKLGGAAMPNHDSVSDGAKVVKAVLDAYGRIDIVVNCAGILRDRTFRKMSDEDWDLSYQTHLRGVFAVTRAAWPHLEKNNYGRIVNVTSSTGLYGSFGQANSAASKSALIGLTATLAVEGAKRNIRANCVAPIGASRMLETVRSKEDLQRLPAHTAANLVAYLCHDSCDCTGAVFEHGGHWAARVHLARSRGVRFAAGFGPEDVAERIKEISDFGEGMEFPTNSESSMKLAMELPVSSPASARETSPPPSKL